MKYTVWTEVVGSVLMLYCMASLRLRFRIGEYFDSDRLGSFRLIIGFRLSAITENVRQGPGIALFSIAGYQTPDVYPSNPGCSTNRNTLGFSGHFVLK